MAEKRRGCSGVSKTTKCPIYKQDNDARPDQMLAVGIAVQHSDRRADRLGEISPRRGEAKETLPADRSE